MAKPKEHNIVVWKMNHSLLLELIEVYKQQQAMECDDMLEFLLLCHLRDMYVKLVALENNMNIGGKCTLKMNTSEALAFHEYWRVTYMDEKRYASVLIRDMIGRVNKFFHNVKIMNRWEP
jgi:hypothetical protein